MTDLFDPPEETFTSSGSLTIVSPPQTARIRVFYEFDFYLGYDRAIVNL